MGLTAEIELSLTDAGLVEFFEGDRALFEEMAEEAYEYASGYVERIHLPLRRDDVAKILVPALNTNEPLREFLAGKKLRQKYWYSNFADLILDRLWEDLNDDHDDGTDDD